MTDEQILVELNNGDKTLVVGNVWYFTGKSMSCTGMTDDYSCCADSYDSFEEALQAIHDLVESSGYSIKLL